MAQNFKQWSVRFRPRALKNVIENDVAVSKVANLIKNQDAHAILFHGETGCGKTTLARILANGLTDNPADITEKNISSERSIDTVRNLITSSQYQPSGQYKVYILDEVHALLGQAQSAILKTLEEPEHDRVVWILCTNRPSMLSPELLNRLFKIEVNKPSAEGLAKYLYRLVKKEDLFSRFKEKQQKRICLEVASVSDRVPREALQIMQEIAKSEGEFKDFKELVVQGIKKALENTVDVTAMKVLMAFYSPDKSLAQRAAFLIANVHEKDMWALTMRLCYIHEQLMNFQAGIRGGPGYYYHKELKPLNAVPDDLRLMAMVASKLVVIRNGLVNLNATLPQYVVPELVNIMYACNRTK